MRGMTDQRPMRGGQGHRRPMPWHSPGLSGGATAGLLAALLALGAVPEARAAEKADQPYVYGPAPDWEKYKQMGEEAIRPMLADPDSARFEWPYGYRQSAWKPPYKARRHGYISCAYVNSPSGTGGDARRVTFVVVIDHGRVNHADIGKSNGHSFLDRVCAYLMQQGSFPLASAMSSAPRPPAMAVASASRMGLMTMPVAHGAYVDAVQTGSAAAHAGLKPGIVISHVNGVPLAGLGEAMQRLLEAAEGEISLRTVSGGSYVLTPAQPAPAIFAAPTPSGRRVKETDQ